MSPFGIGVNIKWIFKGRSDLTKLDANRFQGDGSKLCSLWNVNEEDMDHFIGRCQALKEFRIAYYKKFLLNEECRCTKWKIYKFTQVHTYKL